MVLNDGATLVRSDVYLYDVLFLVLGGLAGADVVTGAVAPDASLSRVLDAPL